MNGCVHFGLILKHMVDVGKYKRCMYECLVNQSSSCLMLVQLNVHSSKDLVCFMLRHNFNLSRIYLGNLGIQALWGQTE